MRPALTRARLQFPDCRLAHSHGALVATLTEEQQLCVYDARAPAFPVITTTAPMEHTTWALRIHAAAGVAAVGGAGGYVALVDLRAARFAYTVPCAADRKQDINDVCVSATRLVAGADDHHGYVFDFCRGR
jgi:hypothetical protein